MRGGERMREAMTELQKSWLPDMDLNHDKQIQSLLCYRYTIGQTGALEKLKGLMSQSSRQTLAFLKEQRDVDACLGHAVPKGQATIAQRFNAGLEANRSRVPKGRPRANYEPNPPTVPSGLVCQAGCFPALKRRAILKMSLRDKGKRHAFKGFCADGVRPGRCGDRSSIVGNFTHLVDGCGSCGRRDSQIV